MAALKASAKKIKAGKAVSLAFSLSEPAAVTVVVARQAPGRKVKGGCRKPGKANRKKKRCTRFVTVKRVKQVGVAGANAVKVRTKGFKPGKYRAALTAVDAAGNAAARAKVTIKVVKKYACGWR